LAGVGDGKVWEEGYNSRGDIWLSWCTVDQWCGIVFRYDGVSASHSFFFLPIFLYSVTVVVSFVYWGVVVCVLCSFW
jgi:hypothetical protein